MPTRLTALWCILVMPLSLAAQGPTGPDKLDPAVRAAAVAGRTSQVLILGSNQLLGRLRGLDSLAAAHPDVDRRALRTTLIARMKAIATTQQPRILAAVGAARADRSLWIANAVLVTLTADQVRRAEASPDVAFVYAIDETAPVGRGDTTTVLPPRERPPFSTQGKRIGWNVERIGAPRVWREFGIIGDGVTVAVLDAGANYAHHDLRDNIWVNAREVAGNAIDDDSNGYVDDLYGYDFNAASGDVLDASDRQHGTLTSGIIAGDGTLGIVTGVAPRARLMELKARGPTAAALAYQYALEQGADVLSMSFSLPGLGNLRGFWRMMSDHAVAAGIVLVGGAGNFQQSAQVPVQHQTPKDVPSVISVGGVDSLDALVPFSSLGPAEWESVALYGDYPMPAGITKPDLVAFPGPGYPMLGMRDTTYTNPNPTIRGNSFSGPHGAGVAALILSAAPWLPAWRVKSLLEETARDLGEPGKDNRTGAGMIDAYAAVARARTTKAPAR